MVQIPVSPIYLRCVFEVINYCKLKTHSCCSIKIFEVILNLVDKSRKSMLIRFGNQTTNSVIKVVVLSVKWGVEGSRNELYETSKLNQ